MVDTLEVYEKINKEINLKLDNSQEEKDKILELVQHEDMLAATLRLHLYAEKELNNIIKSIFHYSKPIIKQKFSSKLNLIFNLGFIDKPLFDAVSKLTVIRNGYAHDLEYGEKKDVYSILRSSLSDSILEKHKFDIQMNEMLHGVIDEEIKFRLLLAQIWIELRVFSTSILLKKFNFARRLQEEVVEELDMEANDEK